LSEEEVRSYISFSDALKDKEIDFYSKGAVGGYSFVVRLEVDADNETATILDAYSLDGSFAEDDPNKNLIIDLFKSSVDQYFSDSTVPSWIPDEKRCNNGVSRYTKQEDGMTIYAYHGVGQCNELFLFGYLD
jgi:hypothetical protein